MSSHFSTLVTLLILIILGLLFVSFVYVWLFIAKKQRLVSYLKPLDKKKEKRRKWRERWAGLLSLKRQTTSGQRQ